MISNIISDKKYLPNIIEFLDDDEIGPEVAVSIAKINHKESIPKIIERLFEKGNSYPSGYAKAIIEFNDIKYIDTIISKTIKIDNVDSNELLIANIAYILSHFETALYLPQIINLLASAKDIDQIIAVKLLEGNNSPKVIELFCNLLDDTNDELKKEAIYSLGDKSWPYEKEMVTTPEIIDKSFKNLDNNNIGSYFSDYLKDLKSESVIEKAHKLIKTAQSGSLKINLANIIFDKFNKLSKDVILEHLTDFKIEYEAALHQCLFLNISDFNKEIIPLVNKTNELRNRFIIENYSNESDDISDFIDYDTCVFLLETWEVNIKKDSFYWHYSIPRFLSLCSKHIKTLLLSKINNKNYLHRQKLLSIVSLLEIKKKDFSEQTINWLFEEMTKEKADYKNNATTIIGIIGDEEFAEKKLKPLLESDNSVLRNNAYIAIEKIENSINKRLIVK